MRWNAIFSASSAFFLTISYSFLQGIFAPAGATKGLSDRPLETFGVRTFGVDFFRKN